MHTISTEMKEAHRRPVGNLSIPALVRDFGNERHMLLYMGQPGKVDGGCVGQPPGLPSSLIRGWDGWGLASPQDVVLLLPG
jgi:hypothetical protein